MPNILFVCTANQFRSPLAEAFLKKHIAEDGAAMGWQVKSAGTWVKEKSRAHHLAIVIAKVNGIDLSSHVTQEINKELINEADLIVVMTENHKEALQYEFQDYKDKIVMLSEISCGQIYDIPDPILNNLINCEDIYHDIEQEINKTYIKLIKQFS